MATKVQASKQKVAAPIVERLLESRAVQVVADNRMGMVAITWLMLRLYQLFFLAPSQDTKRYFDTSSMWLMDKVPYKDFVLEYPPGALVLFTIPRFLVDNFGRYGGVFAVFMLLMDLGIMWFIGHMPERIFGEPKPDAGKRYDSAVAMMAYLAFTGVLGSLPFERYDLALAFLLIGWVYSAMDEKRPWIADLFFALGVWIKLINVILVPVYVVYLYARYRDDEAPKEAQGESVTFVSWLSQRGWITLVTMAANTAVLFAMFWRSGDKLRQFIDYHADRGIQIESIYSAIFLWCHNWMGLPIDRGMAYGAMEIKHPDAATVAKIAPFITLAVLTAVSARFIVLLLRPMKRHERNFMLIRATLGLVMAFMFCNKVFSPQYMLWIAPLAALVAFHDHAKTRHWLLGFTVTFMLSALILQFYYINIIMLDPFGTVMLLLRNTMVAVMVWAVMDIELPEAKLAKFWPDLQLAANHRMWGWAAMTVCVAWVFFANLSETPPTISGFSCAPGEDIMKSGQLPYKEVYSATVAGRPFIAHEWLSGVIFYALVHYLGGAGLSMLAAVAALVSFVFLYYAFDKEERNTFYYMPLVLFISYLVSFRVLVRPHIFTIMAQSALLFGLERWRRNGKLRELLWFIPMQFAWVNLHGAAFFGPVLLGTLCGVVGAMVVVPALQRGSEIRTFTWKDVFHLGGMSLVLAVACLANPYGMELFTWSIELLNNDYAKTRVWEWTTPFMASNISYYWLWLFIAGLFLLWSSILVRIKTLPVIDFVLAATVTFLSVRANRFVPDFAIFAFPTIARSMYYLTKHSLKPELRIARPWVELGIASLLMANAATYGYAHSAREHRPMIGWGFGGDMPYQEVDLIKKMNLRGSSTTNIPMARSSSTASYPRCGPCSTRASTCTRGRWSPNTIRLTSTPSSSSGTSKNGRLISSC